MHITQATECTVLQSAHNTTYIVHITQATTWDSERMSKSFFWLEGSQQNDFFFFVGGGLWRFFHQSITLSINLYTQCCIGSIARVSTACSARSSIWPIRLYNSIQSRSWWGRQPHRLRLRRRREPRLLSPASGYKCFVYTDFDTHGVPEALDWTEKSYRQNLLCFIGPDPRASKIRNCKWNLFHLHICTWMIWFERI